MIVTQFSLIMETIFPFVRINNKGEDIHRKALDFFPSNPLSHSNQNTKNLQRPKLLQQSTILNDIDILSDEDELNLSQNV